MVAIIAEFETWTEAGSIFPSSSSREAPGPGEVASVPEWCQSEGCSVPQPPGPWSLLDGSTWSPCQVIVLRSQPVDCFMAGNKELVTLGGFFSYLVNAFSGDESQDMMCGSLKHSQGFHFQDLTYVCAGVWTGSQPCSEGIWTWADEAVQPRPACPQRAETWSI